MAVSFFEQLGHEDMRLVDDGDDVCDPGTPVQMTVRISLFVGEGLFAKLFTVIVERIGTDFEIVWMVV